MASLPLPGLLQMKRKKKLQHITACNTPAHTLKTPRFSPPSSPLPLCQCATRRRPHHHPISLLHSVVFLRLPRLLDGGGGLSFTRHGAAVVEMDKADPGVHLMVVPGVPRQVAEPRLDHLTPPRVAHRRRDHPNHHLHRNRKHRRRHRRIGGRGEVHRRDDALAVVQHLQPIPHGEGHVGAMEEQEKSRQKEIFRLIKRRHPPALGDRVRGST